MRPQFFVKWSNVNNFNSRTHVECDPHYRERQAGYTFQLTHSRGVRHRQNGNKNTGNHFNSRTHVECDSSSPTQMIEIAHFNSRTHVECDPKIYSRRCSIRYFNSRTHVECDSKYCIKKRFTTQYMGIYCFLSSIILIFFIYSKK